MPSRISDRRLLSPSTSPASASSVQPRSPSSETTRSKPPEGFVALFDGKNLDGWHGMPHFDPRELAAMTEETRAAQIAEWTEDAKKHWSVKDGELVNDGHGAYLTTDKEYGDIELLIDYKTVAKADSGIYLRATPQVQIWDYTKEGGKHDLGADKGSGGLWNNSPGAPGKDPLVLADKPFGEWNRLRIIQVGARTTVYLNDKLVVDHASMENYFDRKSPLFAEGPIQLQTHGGEIRWKNIFLREIPPDEANKLLAARDAEGFQPIFDGKSTDGWTGPIDDYEVVDGAIRCKPGKGGTIYYDKELGRLRRPGRVQAPARRQQRPGDPLSRPGRHRLRRDVRAPGPRRHLAQVRQARPSPGPRLGLRDGRREAGAISGPSASGTSRR